MQEMTVRDAMSFLSPAQQINLRSWAGEFGIQLREFHMGHIKTYESLRLRIASRKEVNAEVSTLLDLLESVGAGEEIKRQTRVEQIAADPKPSGVLPKCLLCGGTMHVVERFTSAQLLLRSPLHTDRCAA